VAAAAADMVPSIKLLNLRRNKNAYDQRAVTTIIDPERCIGCGECVRCARRKRLR
jgi:ferredoxin